MENTETKQRFVLTESTKQLLDETLEENYEELDDHVLIQKINATKKFVAKMTESGQIKVQMVLFG